MNGEMVETAQRAASGTWRKPRMKIYDYNQEFGGNYYQPMIQYINEKEIMGPFCTKRVVYMPERAEVTSDKYNNMRYNDKTSSNLDLDNFLVRAYAKRIKELNSSTAMARVNMIHAAVSPRHQPHTLKDNVTTPYNSIRLLKGAPPGQERVNHYATELSIGKANRLRHEKLERKRLSNVNAFGNYD